MTVSTQIRIDENVKKESVKLFKNLGIDMSTAVNMFLCQCILRKGIPFEIQMPQYNKETIEAIEEAEKISNDKTSKGFKSFDEMLSSINNEKRH